MSGSGEDTTMPAGGTLAAEYALGLIEGEALLAARGRMASDPAFAAEVGNWERRLAPLLDDVASVEPAPHVWPAIAAAIRPHDDTQSAQVVTLNNRLRRWQWATGIASAAAALALAYIGFLPATTPAVPGNDIDIQSGGSAPMMAANFPIEGTPLRLDLMYMPREKKVMVTALGLSADGVHDHEIWLVPKSGDPISLGVVVPGQVTAHSLPTEIDALIAPGSHLVLTREPIGGKPADAAAGPVVSESDFTVI